MSCSQRELAFRLGVSPTQISKWKNPEPSPARGRTRFAR
ncbi:MAG: helix-turn-helix transcriptional regulator [Bryobacterales bacterium]|nr:helix-turn-helix transcriptional regulator [Bryobacterales bacterium]MBV9398505.1 helix-turn-helix transcriptional regulator [Bryobacterales bacterium]